MFLNLTLTIYIHGNYVLNYTKLTFTVFKEKLNFYKNHSAQIYTLSIFLLKKKKKCVLQIIGKSRFLKSFDVIFRMSNILEKKQKII